MLEITIPSFQVYNEKTNEILDVDGVTLKLEHSLVSLRKWEQIWHKPFLGKDEKNLEEMASYFECMTISPANISKDLYLYMPEVYKAKIVSYIEDPMTATWFADKKKKRGAAKNNREIITAEVIYYWMITLNVPVEFQKWHLNTLLTLIRTISEKNGNGEKKDRSEWLSERRALNAERLAKLRKGHR